MIYYKCLLLRQLHISYQAICENAKKCITASLFFKTFLCITIPPTKCYKVHFMKAFHYFLTTCNCKEGTIKVRSNLFITT